MRLTLPAAAVLVLLQQGAPASPGPPELLRAALAAVEGDSARAVQARWDRTLRRDATDRTALLVLGSLARLTYSYPRSDSLLARAVSSGASDALNDYAHLEQGASFTSRGRFREAAAAFQAAATGAEQRRDATTRAEALLGLAQPQSRFQAPATVIPTTQLAESLAAGDPLLTANARCQRAALMSRLGNPPAARALAESGLQAARSSGDRRQQGRCVHTLAQIAAANGDMTAAAEQVGRAAALFDSTRDRASLAAVLQWRGYILNTMGRYGVAQEVLSQAVIEGERAQAMSPVGWSLINLGMIALGMGDRVTARAQLNRAVTLLEGQGDQWGVATARGMLGGVARSARDTAEARRLYASVLAWAEGAGQLHTQVNMLQGLGTVHEMRQEWDSALAHYDRAEAVRDRAHMTGWSGFSYSRSRVAMHRGAYSAAERGVRDALRHSDPDEYSWRYAYRSLLSAVLAARGNLAAAEAELVAATDALDAWRASLSDQALRVRAMQFDPGLDPDYGMATAISALALGGRADAAFALAERRRARDLVDQIYRATATRDSATAPARLSADAVHPARLLPDTATALLAFVTGRSGEPTTLFIVTHTGIRARRLPTVDSLRGDIGRLLVTVEAGGDARALGRRLGSALLASADSLPAGISRLFIVPDGILARVPFEALVLGDGRYAIERFTIGLVPSVASLVALRARPPATGPARVLSLGDPMFLASRGVAEPAPATVIYRAAFDRVGGLPRLSGSAREARLVSRYGDGSVVRLRADASEAWLRRTALDSFRVLHFATHALVDEETSSRTALALAPGGGEDGFLGPADLAGLKLNADLVVLSACRTAGGEVLQGEGVQGLTAPLFQAGARSIVATQWRIADQAAERVVRRFYDGLAGGHTVGESLREAKLAALREGAPASEWAAFVALGDPMTRIPLVAAGPPGFTTAGWLAVAVAIGTALGYSMMRKRLGADAA